MTKHVAFSEFVTSYLETPWGKIVPRDYSIQIGIAVLCLITLYLLLRLIWGERRIYTLLFFAAVISAMILSFRFLIFEPVEIIHFPQYAIIAFLLAAALDKEREGYLIGTLLIMVTLMGIVDEMNQYFYLTRQYTKYLDWNDFFLNEVGASLGLMFYYGFRNFKNNDEKVANAIRGVNVKLLLISTLIPVLFYLIGILNFAPDKELDSGFVSSNGWVNIYLERGVGYYGSWKPGDRGWLVHTLNPLTGTVLMMAYGIMFTRFTSGFKNSWPFYKRYENK